MNRQTILLIATAIVLLGTGYLWIRRASTRPDFAAVGSDPALGTRLDALRKLKEVRVDSDFLKSEAFRSLQVFPQPPPPPATPGRANPFVVPSERGVLKTPETQPPKTTPSP